MSDWAISRPARARSAHPPGRAGKSAGQAVLQGHQHRLASHVARPPDAVAAAGMETLTNREREVVALVAHGLSNDEIADAMVLSPATAKTHVSRAMIKLGARDRAQLVVFAYQTGLVTPARRPGPGSR